MSSIYSVGQGKFQNNQSLLLSVDSLDQNSFLNKSTREHKLQMINELARNAKAYIRTREEHHLSRTISKAAIDE
jgi:hypothetical protein